MGGAGSGNDNPLDWLLARQSLFLDGTIANAMGDAIAGNPSGIFAQGLTPASNVIGHSSVSGVVAERMSSGLADFAYFGFEFEEVDIGGTDEDHPNGSLVGADNSGALMEALPDMGATAADEEAYEAAAVVNGTYAPARLLANPTPSNDYETWQIAQAHAVLNEGCSDFAIEFAADMYGGGPADNNVAVPGGGSFQPDGQIDLDQFGNIAWYGWEQLEDTADFPTRGLRVFPPANGYPPSVDPFTPGVNASAAFVWRHDRFDPGIYNQSSRTWDRVTSSTSSNLNPDNPTNAFCDWPYLIRIRYRLHDAKGQIASGAPLFDDQNNNGSQDAGEPIIDSRNGIWFEQIIPVNRPLPVRVP